MTEAKEKPKLTQHYANAADGTQLSYYSVGSGPGILVVHGAVNFALSHAELAEELSPFYTVHVMSRRGRGLSGGYPTGVEPPGQQSPAEASCQAARADNGAPNKHLRTYAPSLAAAVLATEVSDVHTLLAATGAEYLIGVSSGAVISLNALLPIAEPGVAAAIRRAVIFEPPLVCTDRETLLDLSGVSQYEALRAANNSKGAMVEAMRVVQMGPTWIPRWIMRPLAGRMMDAEDAAAQRQEEEGVSERKGVSTMRGLGSMLWSDFAVVEASMGQSKRFAAITSEDRKVLLLSGDASPLYLRQTVSELGGVIPGTETVVIPGAGHSLLCQGERGGPPALAVPALRKFFQ